MVVALVVSMIYQKSKFKLDWEQNKVYCIIHHKCHQISPHLVVMMEIMLQMLLLLMLFLIMVIILYLKIPITVVLVVIMAAIIKIWFS